MRRDRYAKPQLMAGCRVHRVRLIGLIGGFPLKYGGFEGKARYSEWRFVYVPPAPAIQAGPQLAPVPEKD
jgi:hypothetical protein